MDLLSQVMVWINWAIANGPHLVTAIVSMLSAMIAVALLIPGEQPEKALQSLVDFIAKFSR